MIPGQRPAQPRPKPRPKKRKFSDPAETYAKRLERYRPGLVAVRPGRPGRPLRSRAMGAPPRPDQRADPHDPHPEHRRHQRRGRLRAAARGLPVRPAERRSTSPGIGWGGVGLPEGAPPDWAAVEFAPIPELVEVIRPGGLANQKSPRLQATLRFIREERGDYSLEFLGDMAAIDARDWLTRIDGIGKKTASVLLLFCFGLPLMPVDRHVDRVSKRIGLIPAKGHSGRRPRPVPRDARARPDVRGARQPHPSRSRDLPCARPDHASMPGPAALSLRRPEGDLRVGPESSSAHRCGPVRLRPATTRTDPVPTRYQRRYLCKVASKLLMRYSLVSCRERRGSRSFDRRPSVPPTGEPRAPVKPADRSDRVASRWSNSALVFPFFIVLLFSVIEFSFALNALLSVDFATRERGAGGCGGGNPDPRRLRRSCGPSSEASNRPPTIGA